MDWILYYICRNDTCACMRMLCVCVRVHSLRFHCFHCWFPLF